MVATRIQRRCHAAHSVLSRTERILASSHGRALGLIKEPDLSVSPTPSYTHDRIRRVGKGTGRTCKPDRTSLTAPCPRGLSMGHPHLTTPAPAFRKSRF